jgi:hypothetical protein
MHISFWRTTSMMFLISVGHDAMCDLYIGSMKEMWLVVVRVVVVVVVAVRTCCCAGGSFTCTCPHVV